MNPKTFIVLIILVLPIFAFSEIIWSNNYQPFGTYYENYYANDLTLTQDNGFVIAGQIQHWDPWGNEENHGFLMKIDSFGNQIWANIDDYGYSKQIIETNDGGYLTQDWTSAYRTGVRLVKWTCNGDFEWFIQHDDFSGWVMEKTLDDNIILGGKMMDPNYNNLAVKKVNQNGETIWTKEYFDEENMRGGFNSIAVCSDSSFALTGSMSDRSYYIPIIKIDENGDTLWTKKINPSNGYKKGYCIIENSENNLLITGVLTLGQGYLSLLNDNGNIIWEYYGEELCGSAQYHAVDLPDDCFMISGAGAGVYKCDYDYNLLWNRDDLYPFFEQIDDGFVFYKGGSSIYLMRTDYNLDPTYSDENLIIPKIQINNYPNPFNPSTTINFLIQNDSNVELSIYNMKGQIIKTLAHNEFTKGKHSIIWNGDDELGRPVSSGVYLYKLNVNGKTEAVKKCLLLK